MERSRKRALASTTLPSNDGIVPGAVSSHIRVGRRARGLSAPVHSVAIPALPDASRKRSLLLLVGLASIGGTLGGAMGGGTIALDLEIASTTGSHWVKVVAILAVTWSSLSLLGLTLWLVGRTLSRQARTTSP